MERDTRHVSEDEKKKGLVILILVGILVAIALIIIIIMIPKGKKEETTPVELSSTVTAPDSNRISRDDGTGQTSSRRSSSSTQDLDIIAKDKTKVSLQIKAGTLTVDGAVIVIIDDNVSPYSWTPIYNLQKKVNGKWEDVELKNPENSIFPEIQYNNVTGIMEQSLIWSNKYGKLEKGEYRIVKEASGVEFYAEFDVQ